MVQRGLWKCLGRSSLLVFVLLVPEWTWAIPITFTLDPLGGTLYRYTYTVANDGSLGAGVAVELFDIFFPPALYEGCE
jgi:hypothetical protein